MIYLDSSAVLKLLVREPETAGLDAWLEERADDTWVTSELTLVEVGRAVRRLDEDLLPSARALLGDVDLVRLSPAVVRDAQDVRPPVLRTLDALHLASALRVRSELVALLTYDDRLFAAAEVAGLPAVAPGRTQPPGSAAGPTS